MYSAQINGDDLKQILDERRYILPPVWVIIIGLSAVVIVILGVMLGAVGLINKKHINNNEISIDEIESECFVFFSQCIERQCQICTNQLCSNRTCYDERFKVSYSIFNGSEMISTIRTRNSLERQQINMGEDHRCYYNRLEDIKSVRWTRLSSVSTGSRSIFLGLGLTLVIIASILMFFSIGSMIFIGRIRFKLIRRRNQMLRHLSDEP